MEIEIISEDTAYVSDKSKEKLAEKFPGKYIEEWEDHYRVLVRSDELFEAGLKVEFIKD